MCDLPKNFKKEKEDEDKIDKRYLKSKLRKKRLALSAKRLSKTKKSRENRRKAAALAASKSTAAEPGTSPGTPYKVLIKTEHEIIDKFIEEADVAKDGEVLEEKHLNADKKTITSVTEGDNLKISGEISSVTDIVKKTEEGAENSTDDDCNWMVEQAKPEESENPISGGIDFADFSYVFEQIKNLQNHSSIGCGIEHFNIVGCQQYGLEKTYSVQCRMCNHVKRISCLRPSDASIDINNAAVSATMVTGGGYNQLEEVMSAMNVSCMTKRIFQKCHNDIIDAFEVAAQREMEDAGREEKESAITRGDVVPGSGIPWISVVADGSWMRRSYRRGDYNSLSGVGAIVGYHTKKVLYISVKNKFCTICQTATKNNEEAREHRCFKNWGRNQSSTGMESAAIVEGFRCSIKMHGLIYSILVADGDSSVYKKILDDDPYKEYAVQVRKIECTNHMLRNFGRKMTEIVSKGRYGELRAVVKNNILRMRSSIRKAAEYRFKEKLTLAEQIENLKRDMKNVPSHVFGEHNECQKLAYFCNKYSDPDNVNYVPQLKETGIFKNIEDAMQPLFTHAESLLYTLNNNAVESFNNIIAKFIGGKRINFGRRGSYQGRVSAAVVQFNTKKAFSKLSVAMDKKPTTIVKKMEERRERAAELARKYKKEAKVSYSRKQHHSCDQDYGPNADKPDTEVVA